MATLIRIGLLTTALITSSFAQTPPPPQYDLVLQGGHVIDAKNKISAIRDVAIRDGKIAAVAPRIDPAQALKVVNVRGLYVTPGLIDIHVHVYAGTGEPRSYAGDLSVYPDGFTFRTGVTTVADAGCAGWRNFEDFKQRVIDRSKTRVLAFLNIVGNGMRGGKYENDLADMEAKPAADMALAPSRPHRRHQNRPLRRPRMDAGRERRRSGHNRQHSRHGRLRRQPSRAPHAGARHQKTPPRRHLHPRYSGLRNELDDTGHVNPAMVQARKRGVIFDVGHGGGSFAWRVAVPAIKDGFLPDSISTDLHTGSMNAGMKDMLNVMSKFLAMGLTIDDVIARSTWNPAHEIHQDNLGNLSVGAPADVAVLKIESGEFGYADMYGARLRSNQKLSCELTLRNGKVVYDLNAISRPDWNTLPPNYRQTGDPRWDTISPQRPTRPPQ